MHKNWMQYKNESEESLNKLWKLTEDYKNDYEPDIERGLQRFKKRIAQTEQAPTAIVTPIRNKNWSLRIAAALALLIIAGFVANMFLNVSISSKMEHIVTTDKAAKEFILPDGTSIALNKNSELFYPTNFTNTARIVQLKGEAFFTVTKNPDKPFIVQTDEGEVQVLGTAFNVSAYADEPKMTVEVEEGSVLVKILHIKKQETLKAQEKIIFNKTDATLSPIKSLHWNDTAWKAKKLVIKDRPVSEVLHYLENNFDIQIDYEQTAKIDCPFNATLLDNQASAIIKYLNSTFSNLRLKKVHSKKYQLNGSCH